MNGKAGRTSSRCASASSAAVHPAGPSAGTSACRPPTWKVSPSIAPASMSRRSVVPSASRRAASSGVQGGRERAVLGALAHVGRELLEEERVAARPRHHALQGRLGQRRPGAEQAAAGLHRPAEPGAGPSAPPTPVARRAARGARRTAAGRARPAPPPASWSMRSSSAGSAQCASSKASTSARSRGERRRAASGRPTARRRPRPHRPGRGPPRSSPPPRARRRSPA